MSRAQESTAAFKASQGTHDAIRVTIMALLLNSTDGLTSTDIGRLLNKQKHTFSSRLSELVAAGLARRTDRRRDGCAVLVAVNAA